jgi:hypothetical protein
LFFCVVRAWRRLRLLFFELRAYGSPASRHPIFGFFVLRAHGSPAIMAPYFCCARGAEAEVAFLRCAHMGVPRSWHPIFLLRARGGGGGKRNAFRSREKSCHMGCFTQLTKRVLYYKRRFQKIKFWKSDSERQNAPARLANMVKGRRAATIYQVRE